MTKLAGPGTRPAKINPIPDMPIRQGFYLVTLKNGTEMVAEWRERGKNTGKRWWTYVSSDPTVEKKPVPLDQIVVKFRLAGKGDVDNALKREPTLEEKIQEAYNTFVKSDDTDERYKTAIPASRLLKAGDKVYYGSLQDPTVVGVFDEGRIVVFSHHHVVTRHGQTEDFGLQYRAVYWTEVLPRTEGASQFGKESRIYGAYLNSTLKSIITRGLRGVDDSPKYQRDYVWTAQDKENFLESVFGARELGRFIFIERPYPHMTQVLDGKQRLNCLMEFVTSQIPYRGVYWHDLSWRDRHLFEGRSIQYADLKEERFTQADLMEIFLEVNIAGVPQSEEHLANVRKMLDEERSKA